jgi:hypothetical protein
VECTIGSRGEVPGERPPVIRDNGGVGGGGGDDDDDIGPPAYSSSQLSCESMNYIRHFGRTPWTEDRPVVRPLSTQDSTTQKDPDAHPYLEQDSNP